MGPESLKDVLETFRDLNELGSKSGSEVAEYINTLIQKHPEYFPLIEDLAHSLPLGGTKKTQIPRGEVRIHAAEAVLRAALEYEATHTPKYD